MFLRSFLSLFFLTVAYTTTNAQIMLKTEYIGSSNYRDDNFDKVGKSKGSAMVYQAGINVPLSMKMNENNRPTMWSVAASGSYTSLDNKNFEEDLVLSEIMNLQLSLVHMRPLGEKWSMMAALGAGVYTADTRFSKIHGDQLLATGAVVFIRHFKPNLSFGGGLAINNTFGYPMVFPAIYFDWRSEGNFAFKVSMMNGLELSAGYSFGKVFALKLVGEMNGQMAMVEKDGDDKIFTHQYIIGGLRPEFKIGKKITIPLTFGVSATRAAYYNDRSLKAMFRDKEHDPGFDAAPYASAGVMIGF